MQKKSSYAGIVYSSLLVTGLKILRTLHIAELTWEKVGFFDSLNLEYPWLYKQLDQDVSSKNTQWHHLPRIQWKVSRKSVKTCGRCEGTVHKLAIGIAHHTANLANQSKSLVPLLYLDREHRRQQVLILLLHWNFLQMECL